VGVSDTNDHRLQVARERGASQTANVASAPLAEQVEPVDVILECSGAAPAVQAAFGVAAPAARVILVGMGASDLELPVATIQIKELWVTGVFRYANCYPAAIALASNGSVDLDSLVTGKFGLEQVREALTASRTDAHSLKPVVYPGSDRI